MGVGAHVLIDANFLLIFTFLNVDLGKIEEAETTEDENQEYRINKFGLIAFILELLLHLKICPLT